MDSQTTFIHSMTFTRSDLISDTEVPANNPRPNPDNKPKRRVCFSDEAEASRSTPDVCHLEAHLDQDQESNHCRQSELTSVVEHRKSLVTERKKFGFTIHNLKWQINRLEGLLELREREFAADVKNSCETLKSYKQQIFQLNVALKSHSEQVASLQREKEEAAARQKQDYQKLEQDHQKQDKQLKDQLYQVEQQLQLKDNHVLYLTKENEGLSQRLTEALNQLLYKEEKLLQSENSWQTRFKALQENLNQKEDTLQQVQQEKKNLQELSIHTRRGLVSHNKWVKSGQKTLERKTQRLEKKRKIKDLKEKESLSARLCETEKELTRTRVNFMETNKAWQQESRALQDRQLEDLDRQNQSWDERLKQFEDQYKILIQQVHSCEDQNKILTQQVHSCEDQNKILTQQVHSCEDQNKILTEKVQQQEEENKVLVDKYLQKKNRRGFNIFGKTGRRDGEKNKKDKATKKKEKEEKKEKVKKAKEETLMKGKEKKKQEKEEKKKEKKEKKKQEEEKKKEKEEKKKEKKEPKKKKGFMRWLRKTGNSDSEVEEAGKQ